MFAAREAELITQEHHVDFCCHYFILTSQSGRDPRQIDRLTIAEIDLPASHEFAEEQTANQPEHVRSTIDWVGLLELSWSRGAVVPVPRNVAH